MRIEIGQQWLTHSGAHVIVQSYDESHWIAIDKQGRTFKYSEGGRCYPEAYSAYDLKEMVSEPHVAVHASAAPDDADLLASETLQALGWVFDGQCWTAPEPKDDIVNHPLYAVFADAIVQAMYGKGKRHGGNATPFLDQPWVHYTKMHGRGFATGQAAKKLEEAASTRSGDAFETEMLGAIVYAGMAILKERGIV